MGWRENPSDIAIVHKVTPPPPHPPAGPLGTQAQAHRWTDPWVDDGPRT